MIKKDSVIGILGLGLTGQKAFEFLNKKGMNVICYDDKEDTRKNFISKYGNDFIKEPNDIIWNNIDNLLLSPGIDPNHRLVKLIKENNINIISDIELFFNDIKQAIIIAITGTNGKSTTTALTNHIIKEANLDYEMAGNIGKSVLTLPKDKTGYILELSSYQIDLLNNLPINIAVLLNITPDHLERYGNMNNYIKSKLRIFSLMKKEDFAIISLDNENTKSIANINPKIIFISTKQIAKHGVSIINGEIHDNIKTRIIMKLPFNQSLLGEHNYENIAASYTICRLLNIPIDNIIKSIETFPGLEHRMQYLGAININNKTTVNFYNDSKATNADAASKSIELLSANNIIYWIAGGVSKSEGIKPLIPYLKKIRKGYFYGKDKYLFANTIEEMLDFEIFDSLEDATKQAFYDAVIDNRNQEIIEQQSILLAPAGASTDQFKNFEERGNKFIDLYKTLSLTKNIPNI